MNYKQIYRFRALFFVLIVLWLPWINSASGLPILLGDSSADKKPLSWLIQQMENMPEQRRMDDSVVDDQLKVFSHLPQLFIPFSCISKLIEEYLSLFQAQFNFAIDVNLSYCQKQNVPLGGEIVFVGDIHGSAHSLLKIIKKHVADDFKIIKNNLYIVFTGDYVDRGMYGVEVWYTLLRLKLANWDKVFVLRGNHENLLQNSDTPVGFFAELVAKYGVDNGVIYLKKFDELYKRLVLVLYLKSGDNWIQCCHGAIDPCCDMRYFLNNSEMVSYIDFNKIGYGRTDAVNGFVWGDFQGNGSTIEMNLRRISWLEYLSTCDMVKWFKESGIHAIFRGHQHNSGGLSLFKDQTQLGAPIQWDGVVSMEEWAEARIVVAHQKIPIFTFTTATEYGIVDRAVYGILKTDLRFEDWILNPVII